MPVTAGEVSRCAAVGPGLEIDLQMGQRNLQNWQLVFVTAFCDDTKKNKENTRLACTIPVLDWSSRY